MPEFNFIRDILRPALRDMKAEKTHRTVKTEGYIAGRLERFFKGYYISWTPEHWSGRHPLITGAVVREYRERRKSEGISPATIKRELSVASACCRHCIRELDMDIPNPFFGRTVGRADARQIRPRDRVLTDEERRRVLDALPQPHRDMVEFMLEAGLRIGEVLHLKWSQIQGQVIRFTPSEHKSRDHAGSYLSPRALELAYSQPVICDHVFTRQGRRVYRSTFYCYWYRALKACGLYRSIRPQDLRRTCGTTFRREYGLEVAQAQLRHKDKQTTERVYARSSVELVIDAISRNRNNTQRNDIAEHSG